MKVKPIKRPNEAIVGKYYRDNHGVVIWVFDGQDYYLQASPTQENLPMKACVW